MPRWILSTLSLALAPLALADTPAAPRAPLVFRSDFARGSDGWTMTDPGAWKVIDTKEGKALSQLRQSKYKPPYRSPLNIALVKNLVVSDFVLEAKVQSTTRDYAHRDMCLFFGYQGPARFYYAHLGKKTDEHANQIFIVHDAARKKISTKTTSGTPWTDGWHRVKVVRRVKDGTIAVYFDDMEKPAMTATDQTFTWGQVGVGSFDDTGNWTDVRVWGVQVEKPR